MLRSPEEAMAAAQEAMPACRPVDAVVSDDGRAAIVLDRSGGVVAVKLRGRRTMASAVEWSTLRQTYDGIMVETDTRFGTAAVLGATALDIRRLGAPVEEKAPAVPREETWRPIVREPLEA
jgi:hypothetical protein